MTSKLVIGSVVRLKIKNTTPIAVIGYAPEINGNKYDYSGVVLPFGLVKDGSIIAFNNSQIETVEFEGYQTEKLQFMIDMMDTIGY